MSISNEGSSDEQQPLTAMEEIINALDMAVSQSSTNVDGYRALLGRLDHQNMSWEDPQPDNGEAKGKEVSTHLSTIKLLLSAIQCNVNRQSEMLDHYKRFI